ncbi:MAG: ABC transporter permease [Chitinophagales bacterium]
MRKLRASIWKEILVLSRDKAGLSILFIMPISLTIIMALIQDAPFKDFQETKIEMLFLNKDLGNTGGKIEQGLQNTGVFQLQKPKEDSKANLEKQISSGKDQIGIYIPPHATEILDHKTNQLLNDALGPLGLPPSADTTRAADSLWIEVFIDPATKRSFKNAIVNAIGRFASAIESQNLLDKLSARMMEIGEGDPKLELQMEPFIGIKEIYAGDAELAKLESNSVQHNVPAWTLFALFFIVIPMAGNMIKEKNDGTTQRLMTILSSPLFLMIGKIVAYLLVGILQLLLMLLLGKYFLPLLGLPALVIGNAYFAILSVAISSCLAATGFGILTGTVFNTHQQAATFGSVSVVLLAAIGGVWVPLYIMPPALQIIGRISPLNWGLEAFNTLFLRGGQFPDIFPLVMASLLFFFITFGLSMLIERRKAAV